MIEYLKELIPYFPFKTTAESLLYKPIIAIALSAFFAICIYVANACLKNIRGKDALELKEQSKWYMWVLGAVLTTIILFALQIISFKIQAILLVAFVWDKLFEKAYNAAKEQTPSLFDKNSFNPKNLSDITAGTAEKDKKESPR